MSIKSFIKGKLKQIEIRKLKPDENFEFEKELYGETNIIEGFNFVYCNNYTDTYCNYGDEYKHQLSFISCVISLPTESKTLKDLGDIINSKLIYNYTQIFKYNNIYIDLGLKEIKLYLRGDILFYTNICNNIHNNIFTKYIRNNIFPNESIIETPNEFLNTMYNSINNPSKEVDILFIENNILCDNFTPVIGLSIKEDSNNILRTNNSGIIVNKRFITYVEINRLSSEQLSYLINEVRHGDKLLELVHKYVPNNDYSDIDEIIEE